MNLVDLTAVPDGPDNTSICVKCNDSHSSDKYNSEESKMLTLFDSTLSVIAMEWCCHNSNIDTAVQNILVT